MIEKTELVAPKRRTRAEVQQLVAQFVSSGMRRSLGKGPSGNHPQRVFTILEQPLNNKTIEFRIVSQLAVLPTGKPPGGANAKTSVAGDAQAYDIAAGKLLPHGRLPGNGPYPIEPEQAKFGTQSEIPVGCLGNRRDATSRKPFAELPCGVRVLIHIERWIQCKNTTTAREENAHRDNSFSSFLHLVHLRNANQE
jgi:hypothetical protein